MSKVNRLFQSGIAREHAYRPDFQNLILAILPGLDVTNEPARVECGAPDYVVTKKSVPVGYIEAKDVGVDLNSKTLKEQFDRYKAGLSNLIFTDYLEFHFYKEGALTTKIAIATIDSSGIKPKIIGIPENFEVFQELIRNFAQTVTQTIKSPTKLAQMMAGKAKLMADVIEKSLDHDDKMISRTPLRTQMLSFQQMLIHDIDNKAFSDIYAQTIAYGMFAARYHDPTLPTFSRMEAAELIPKSNPFLRKLFQDIAGFDLDDRLVWIVDELVSIFLASDVATIMKNFGKSTKQEDPVVHFYETFLAEYSPALRKARGVWYTPQPVVNFIVRAVDDILINEFNLPQGLADTSKIKIKKKGITQTGKGQNSKIKEVEEEIEVHKVQILDPATGTGTFLAEVVRHIHKRFEGQQGIWSKYVKNDLIPRLNGFELLMASYAMAHLKMDMLLTETGYKPTDDQRFRIFLTNSLEEAHPDTTTLFSSWLSDEADQANAVKRDAPVMVIIGNPPYSGESANKGKWIMDLMEDYKKEPGGKEKLKERNPKWINDDYVKFLRFGQHFIEKNGSGVLAFINPHGFLDNPTFRGMRWNLLTTYDKLYTIDLHGNSKKKERAPDGSVDQNVFDIMQGVSINIFVKNAKRNVEKFGEILHKDVFGKRQFKYDFLLENTLKSIDFDTLSAVAPNFFLVAKDMEESEGFDKGFLVSELFKSQSMGVTSGIDSEYISFSMQALAAKFTEKNIKPIDYRPFDRRYINYDVAKLARARSQFMKNFEQHNIAICLVKRSRKEAFVLPFLSRIYVDKGISSTLDNANIFPLYIYAENNQQSLAFNNRVPNFSPKLLTQIAEKLDLTFTSEKEQTVGTFAPIDLLDYIYAVLHSPNYREKYKEFLKINFPRVPYPENQTEFWKLVKLGGELREIHLLESPIVEKYITQFPEDGNGVVTKPLYEDGNVFINETQYFKNVPEGAWNFYIGGYQPAQKWLKDRKGRELSMDDIFHYQKIIVALTQTDRIMKKIDSVLTLTT